MRLAFFFARAVRLLDTRRRHTEQGEGLLLQGRWAGKHLDCTALAERQRHLVDRQCAELTDEIVPGHDWGPVDSAPLGAFLDCRGDGCAGVTIEARSRASG
jgi:hypothetical protein